MDQHLEKYPLLSYVLFQLDPTSHAPPSAAAQQTLSGHFTHLTHHHVTRALTQFIPPTINQTLFLVRSLGPRPDPLAVSSARLKTQELAAEESPPEEKEELEKELEICRAVLKLEEVHEAYEKEMRELEDGLVRVYAAAVEEIGGGGGEVNEEVVAVLKEVEKGGVVERVDLSSRKLRILPEAFGKIHGLVLLNLSHNELKFIPDAISGLQKLEELDVSSNNLEYLPDSIGLLLNLKALNVSGNKLTALPDSIAHCRSLVELDASFNNLISLPANIGYGLLNLEKLSVQLNKIAFLPTSVCEMRSLRCIDAHMNELHGLPLAIGRLTNLEVLNLSSNFSDLRVLPDTICDLINLRELDLSNNQIRALPDAFGRLEKLEKLNLDQNPLEIPPLEIANKGAEAVREFMAKRWAGIIAEEQQKSTAEANMQQGGGARWLSWGTSLVTNFVSSVSQSVGGYMSGGAKSSRDSYLDQQL